LTTSGPVSYRATQDVDDTLVALLE
jgi:hypothetical protein